MLTVQALESGYGAMQVLWHPELEIEKGSITSLLGPNGAGKSTLLETILGSVRPWGGQVLYENRDITFLSSHRKVEMGLALVPEGKHLFPNMTVYENLLMGAYLKKAYEHREESLDIVYTLFPRLKERSRQMAGLLSGGEQQMTTIGRALMTKPRLMMLDEPSQGLAPKLAAEVFETIEKLKSDIGLTILLVEQNADASLGAADYAYIMHEGKIKASGTPEQIKASREIREAFLGV
ncbi:MAG: ABC transporter ATP-binding protein [Desulfobacterales bacterium]|nr:ABC transporter ATP-binding protein [Desulfobacterales bacterium]